MSDNPLLLGLVNSLLNWEEHAHKILGDYLEEMGFERRFHQFGGLHSRVGVVRALLQIGALDQNSVQKLDLPSSEQKEAIELAQKKE